MRHITFIVVLLLSITDAAEARPVSYPGGWTVMTMNDAHNNSLHVHYSPTAKYSVGWRHDYLRGPKAHADTVQLNNLLKRWNMPAAQANLYLKSGAGVAYEDGDINPAAFTGIAADIEDRRFFASYENRFFWANDIEKFARHSARLGVAPYIGDYGDLHTWLMIQADYDAGEKDNSFTTTPLLRFFNGPSLLEAGYNIQNETTLFNFVQRF